MNLKNFAEIKRAIDLHPVISFDVFDTLIVRSFSSPKDVFRSIGRAVSDLSHSAIYDFANLRQLAEKTALRSAEARGIGEVSLDDIYRQMGELTGVEQPVLDKIRTLELRAELDCTIARPIGKNLFNYAVAAGKTVVLASDMYLPRGVIMACLDKVGIKSFDRLYLSSELGETKRTGKLFDIMLVDLCVEPAQLLHIGDNPIGDDEVPRAKGISVGHVQRPTLYLQTANTAAKAVHALIAADDDLGLSVIRSLVARRFYDEYTPSYEASLFAGNAFQFGYVGLGLMVISFASWLFREARRDGIKRLYFLSRDGWILKEVFDVLFRDRSDKPETVYLLCSRRSTRVPLMFREVDYFEPLKRPVYSTEIGRWLSVNYGIDGYAVPVDVFERFDMDGPAFRIGGKFDREKLRELVIELVPTIARQVNKEREDFLSYLKQAEFGSSTDGIVDIGYAATMQNALNVLTQANVYGYYLGIFGSAFSSGVPGDRLRGYVTNGGSNAVPTVGICTHRFLYESVVCSDEDSFVRMVDEGGRLTAERVVSENDLVRKQFVREAHAGAIELAVDFARYSQVPGDRIFASGVTATAYLDQLFRHPLEGDVGLLSGVRFDDLYGPEQLRVLAPAASPGTVVNAGAIVWKESLKYYDTNAAVASGKHVEATTTKATLSSVARKRPPTKSAPPDPLSSDRTSEVLSMGSAEMLSEISEPSKPGETGAGGASVVAETRVASKSSGQHGDAEKGRLKELVETARSKFQGGHYVEAGQLFESAWSIKKRSRYARAAAEAFAIVGDFNLASKHLLVAVEAHPTSKKVKSRLDRVLRGDKCSLDDPEYFDVIKEVLS